MQNNDITYEVLGFTLGAKFKLKDIWNSIIEKMEHRLAGWKRLYLSKGGHLTLLKSTLSNLPTYYLSLFPISVEMAKQIEKIQRNFLWGSTEEVHKFHLVKWEVVCSPFSSGGLGIKNLRKFNEALLGKWLWRFGTEREALWRKVVVAKYDILARGWMSNVPIGPHGVGLWKFIRARWDNFYKLLMFEVGAGSLIQFWDDVWCIEQPLKLAYPELYRIACNKEAVVADFVHFRGDSVYWEVNFTRLVQDWELESVSSFLEVLYSAKINRYEQDKMCCQPSPSNGFQVKSFYKHLSSLGVGSFLWKNIWKTKVPPRVAFFS